MILGNVALARGDEERGLELYESAIDVHRRSGDVWGLGILLSIAAGRRLVRGDLDQARQHATEALGHARALRDPRGIAWSLEVFAGLYAAKSDPGVAARLWGLSDSLLNASGGTLTATIGWVRDRYIAPARGAMGDASFGAAFAEGTRLSLDEATTIVTGT
jgi:hypothetical protein